MHDFGRTKVRNLDDPIAKPCIGLVPMAAAMRSGERVLKVRDRTRKRFVRGSEKKVCASLSKRDGHGRKYGVS